MRHRKIKIGLRMIWSAIDKVNLGNLTGLLKKITPAVEACQHHTGTKTSKDADFVDMVIG